MQKDAKNKIQYLTIKPVSGKKKKIVAYFQVDRFPSVFASKFLQVLLLCMLQTAAGTADLCILAPTSHLTLMESHKLGRGQIPSPL